MAHRADRSGHVPARPPLVEGAAVIGQVVPEVGHRHAARIGDDAAGEHARNAERVVRIVAAETRVVAYELRRGHLQLRKQIEDDSLLRVLGGELDEPAAHPAHGDGIVEEQRPRIPRGDDAGLHAGFGKDGDLRVAGDLQGVQRRLQVAADRVVRELHLAARQPSIQLGDRIVRGARVVRSKNVVSSCADASAPETSNAIRKMAAFTV